jgi:hypothetical protein
MPPHSIYRAEMHPADEGAEFAPVRHDIGAASSRWPSLTGRRPATWSVPWKTSR